MIISAPARYVSYFMELLLAGFHLGGGGGGGIRPLLECVCPPLEIMWSYISDNDAPPQHPEFYICPPFGNFLNETLTSVSVSKHNSDIVYADGHSLVMGPPPIHRAASDRK